MKRYISALILAICFTACSDKLALTPAISFFSDQPELTDSTATFRLAVAFRSDSTSMTLPVTFGGTAERGTDYIVSADAFIIGGSSPMDSIVVTTLKYGSEKTVSLTVALPEGMESGKYLTSGFTIQDSPAYFTFERDFGILADSTSTSVFLTDKAGKKKTLSKDITAKAIIDKEKTTALEGSGFTLEEDFVIKAGQNNGRILLKQLQAPQPGRDRIVLNISHDELYGDGQFHEIEIRLMDMGWRKMHGAWSLDTIVTDMEYMQGFWGDMCTGYDLLPKYTRFEAMDFDMDACIFKPTFYSTLEHYFLEDSYFKAGPVISLELEDGSSADVQTFLMNGTNRYFSEEEKSEDTESYIGFRLLEGHRGASDTLSLYIIDHTSRSFMPELEAAGRYAAEKPVAASPGLWLNARFIKN